MASALYLCVASDLALCSQCYPDSPWLSAWIFCYFFTLLSIVNITLISSWSLDVLQHAYILEWKANILFPTHSPCFWGPGQIGISQSLLLIMSSSALGVHPGIVLQVADPHVLCYREHMHQGSLARLLAILTTDQALVPQHRWLDQDMLACLSPP